jgi:predicted lipoprotein with Yx(FWY)xxD motif
MYKYGNLIRAANSKHTEENSMVRKSVFVVLIATAVALFAILIGLSPVGAQNMTPTVQLGSTADLGSFLTDSQGMTLYVYANDTPGVSNCTGGCLAKWPALTVAEGETPTLAAGIPGRLGVIQRPDDSTYQVVYNGMPLYTFASDTQPGDTTGQGVAGVWSVAKPADVSLGGNAGLGPFLVGPNDMTLYMYTKDTPGVSNCTGACLEKWPALTVPSGQQPTEQLGLTGKIGTITRQDGSVQVTYNDMPLYFWASDSKPGDATGQNVGGVWFVIQPPTVQVGGNSALGSFLVGPDGMTLYEFTKDTAGVSNCTGACLEKWPALTVPNGMQPTAGDGVTGTLGTIQRADGTYQVTLDDMPLYYWYQDVVPGDANGQNVGQVWFVVAPDGTMITGG